MRVTACSPGRMGLSCDWTKKDILPTYDWQPRGWPGIVEAGRRYDRCGHCGYERCVIWDARGDYVMRYDQRTRNGEPGEERPDALMVMDKMRRDAELEHQRRQAARAAKQKDRQDPVKRLMKGGARAA